MALLEIKNLHVEIEGREILKGINLSLNEGEIHAIMGPNGHGKSTLLAAIMGHPKYTVTQGSVTFDGKDVLAMEVNERAQAGLFFRDAISNGNLWCLKFRFYESCIKH